MSTLPGGQGTVVSQRRTLKTLKANALAKEHLNTNSQLIISRVEISFDLSSRVAMPISTLLAFFVVKFMNYYVT